MRKTRGARDDVSERFDLLGTRIPLVSLVYVVTVARHLSFRHAATSLGVSQSSVSQRIKDLEDILGTILFERRHRGVRLTEAGRYFVDEISPGLGHLDHAVKTVSALSRGMKGEIGIGLHSWLSGGFLRDLLAAYREKWPDIAVQLCDGRSNDMVAQVRDGALDIAFVFGNPDAADCHSRVLWTERLLVALPASHRIAGEPAIAWRDLAGETFLARHGGAGPQVHDHLIRRIGAHGPPPQIRRCDVERDTLMAMVAMQDGVTLVTDSATRVVYPGVVFVPIADEPEPAAYTAIWSPHNHGAALKNLLDLAAGMRESSTP